jgi:hypothetical protein
MTSDCAQSTMWDVLLALSKKHKLNIRKWKLVGQPLPGIIIASCSTFYHKDFTGGRSHGDLKMHLQCYAKSFSMLAILSGNAMGIFLPNHLQCSEPIQRNNAPLSFRKICDTNALPTHLSPYNAAIQLMLSFYAMPFPMPPSNPSMLCRKKEKRTEI